VSAGVRPVVPRISIGALGKGVDEAVDVRLIEGGCSESDGGEAAVNTGVNM
jgi:hypothetical protein